MTSWIAPKPKIPAPVPAPEDNTATATTDQLAAADETKIDPKLKRAARNFRIDLGTSASSGTGVNVPT